MTDLAACQTGIAGATAASNQVVCSSSMPHSAQPNGAGMLCFSSRAACEDAPNACSAAGGARCVQNAKTCATGRAAQGLPAGSAWVCNSDLPPGALPNAAGRFCYATAAACAAGPSGCGVAGGGCVFNAFVCSTGLAATGPHAYVCPTDIPLGGAFSAATGGLCFESAVQCIDGPTSCDSSTPAKTCASTSDSAAMRGLCPADAPFLCPADFPVGASATASGVCYDTQSHCQARKGEGLRLTCPQA